MQGYYQNHGNYLHALPVDTQKIKLFRRYSGGQPLEEISCTEHRQQEFKGLHLFQLLIWSYYTKNLGESTCKSLPEPYVLQSIMIVLQCIMIKCSTNKRKWSHQLHYFSSCFLVIWKHIQVCTFSCYTFVHNTKLCLLP